MSKVRRRVREHVYENPGVHFNELARNLDIATGQAQYHLRKLRRRDDVVAEEIQGRTHYFDGEFDAWERRVLSLCRRETTRAIIGHLLDDGELTATDLTERLDVARSTVSWHVSSLVDAGVVQKSYGRHGRVELALERPAETERLLERVTPSLSDRLVDRFARLVDGGLAADDD